MRRIFIPIALLMTLLSACVHSDDHIYYSDHESEYEKGMEVCNSKPTDDMVTLCRFHWRLAYAEKYTATWADYKYW